jgi:hypothetical protein
MLLVGAVPENLPGAVELRAHAEEQVPVGDAGPEPPHDLDAAERARHQPIRVAAEVVPVVPPELVKRPEPRVRADRTLELREETVRQRRARVAQVMPAPAGDLGALHRVSERHARDVEHDGAQVRQPGVEGRDARRAHLEARARHRVEAEGGERRRHAGQERHPRLIGERGRLAQATEGAGLAQARQVRQLPRFQHRLDQRPLGRVKANDGDARHQRKPIARSARETRISARVS